MSASEALLDAAVAALRGVSGLGVFDGAPVQAAFPHALVEIGPEGDWGHKNGAGREMRLAVLIRDAGERPVGLRRLMSEAEASLDGLNADLGEWRLVTLALQRARLVREQKAAWTGLVEFRARLLRAG